jgi:GDPmannose 4,6-dehydratase
MFNGREVKSKAYVISISDFSKRQMRASNVSTVAYNDEVWCVEVADNHNLLVERNGRVNFSGNSSEMFGGSPPPQDEETPMRARSPYAAAKIYGHNMVRNYRESYGMFCCSSICFNHETERRPIAFVSRKITNAVARIKLHKQDKLELGNLEGSRDWGYAPDYVKGMLMMLERDQPDDFVLGTGIGHTVRDFAKAAFDCVGLNYERYVEINPRYVRPSETYPLLANPAKANTVLGWKAETTFEQLVETMVSNDLKLESGK